MCSSPLASSVHTSLLLFAQPAHSRADVGCQHGGYPMGVGVVLLPGLQHGVVQRQALQSASCGSLSTKTKKAVRLGDGGWHAAQRHRYNLGQGLEPGSLCLGLGRARRRQP